MPIRPYCVAKKPSAPSRIASETSVMSGVPSSRSRTHAARKHANANEPAQLRMTRARTNDTRRLTRKSRRYRAPSAARTFADEPWRARSHSALSALGLNPLGWYDANGFPGERPGVYRFGAYPGEFPPSTSRSEIPVWLLDIPLSRERMSRIATEGGEGARERGATRCEARHERDSAAVEKTVT